MLTKKKNIITDPLDSWVSDRITTLLKSVNITFSAFKNQYYDIIRSTLERMKYYSDYYWKGIDEDDVRSPTAINEMFEITKTLNALNNVRISALKTHLQSLSDSTVQTANELTNIISNVGKLVDTAEASIIKQASSAIRNEIFSNIQGWNPENFTETTLHVDTEEQRLTLPFTQTNRIAYIIEEVTVSGDPLIVRRNNGDGAETEGLYYPGYYFGKFLDLKPDFNNIFTQDNITDNDNDTSAYVESYEEAPLRVVVTLRPVTTVADIGYLRVSFGKCSDSPIVETVEVRSSAEKNFRDITNRVASAGLNVQSVQLSKSNRIASVKNGDGFQFVKLTLNEENVEKIRLTLTVENSEEVFYKEYEVLDPLNQSIRRLNFFETLYYDRFSFEEGEISLPDTGIKPDEIDALAESNNFRVLRNSVNKRYMNIRGIDFYGQGVTDEGYAITKAIGRGNTISSIELYTEDKVDPEELASGALQYSITTDGVTYIPIWPINRANPDNHKTRIVIDPADPERENIPVAGSIRIRIDMKKGYSNIIPALYYISVRIKESTQ